MYEGKWTGCGTWKSFNLPIFFENRDKIKNEIKAINSKGDSESDDRRKEITALKNQIQKDREELRGQLENDTSMVLKQLEKDSGTHWKSIILNYVIWFKIIFSKW